MKRRLLYLCVLGLASVWLAPSALLAVPIVDPLRGGEMDRVPRPYISVEFERDTSRVRSQEILHNVGGYVLRYFPGRSTAIAVVPALQYAGQARRQALLNQIARQPGIVGVTFVTNIGRELSQDERRPRVSETRGDPPELDGAMLEWAPANGTKNSRSYFYATHPNK